MFKTQGSELYKDLILFIHNNTEAIAKGNKLALSQAFDVANYIIEDFNHSDDLMESAITFYNSKDLYESHAVNEICMNLMPSMLLFFLDLLGFVYIIFTQLKDLK